jgi:hypothetical protein
MSIYVISVNLIRPKPVLLQVDGGDSRGWLMDQKEITHPGLSVALQILKELSPRPKTATARSRKRKAESAEVITLSPYKQRLEDSEMAKGKPKLKTDGSKRVGLCKGKAKSCRPKLTRKDGNLPSKSSGKAGVAVRPKDAVACLYCNDTFSNEGWIQCQICSKWAHNSCAGVDRKCDKFVCEICE